MSSNWLERWTCRTRREWNRDKSLSEVIAVSRLREKRETEKKTDEQAQTDLWRSNTALQTMENIDLTKQKKPTTPTKLKQNIMKITEG